MIERLATTPFGGGSMSARLFARQKAVADRQEKLRAGDGGNDGGQTDKWQLIRALTEAAGQYGLGDRTIGLLEALLSFTTERMLDGSQPIIVFPSNRELSLRSRGMAPATIRRHLSALVEAGLIFRRDSPNGKRFCRRDDHGQVEDAYGFDLSPLALRAGEIHAAADKARAEDKAIRALRSEITLHRRDVAKIIACAMEEGREGDWEGLAAELGSIAITMPRNAPSADLERRREQLLILREQVEDTYLKTLSEEEMSANDVNSERQQQNSNTDSSFEISGYDPNTGEVEKPETQAPERKLALSLARFRRTCPQIGDYAKDGIAGWADLIKTADLVRSMLGVSPDAWHKAKTAMGEQAASVVVAIMLEKADTIRSPGGYLRDLTTKAQKGTFSIFPMLQALERQRQ